MTHLEVGYTGPMTWVKCAVNQITILDEIFLVKLLSICGR